MSTVTRTPICALKDLDAWSLAWNEKVKVIYQHFYVFFTFKNSSCYARGIYLKFIFFQDDFTWPKVILDFKTGRGKLLDRSLMFCVFITAQYIQCTYLQFCYPDTWDIECSQNPLECNISESFLTKKLLVKNFIFTKHCIVQLKHTFWNVKFCTQTHMRLKLL